MASERIGKYQVRSMLGQGGMGAVMLAYDPDLDREVAIKLIVPHRLESAQTRERFLREARALARLSDPHVVQVHAFEPDAEPPYLVMERLVGEDLKSLLRRSGPLPPAMLRDCAWQCVRGLAAAHAAGIVHRDLKPSNVMLCRGGVYKLLDFGLAASHDGDLTASGEVVGTRRYIAPERMAGDRSAPAADLWALGVLICELATGRHPYAQSGPVADPQALPTEPPELRAWVQRLIEIDPQQRPRDAGEALQLLGGAREVVVEPQAGAAPLPAVGSTSSGSRAVVTATHRPVQGASSASQALPRPRLPFWLKLTAAIWLVSSIGTVAAGYAITERAVATQLASLHRTLIGIAVGGSQLVDPEAHRRMAEDPAGQAGQLAELRLRLARYATAFPEIRYIYTMAPLPETPSTGVVQFVCDASAESDLDGNGVIGATEAQARPGQRYAAKDTPELMRGFTTPGCDHELTTDDWGVWISGYAPLLLPDGTSAGLLGVDIPADHIARLRRDFLWHSAILLGSTLVAFLAAGLIIAWRMRRPVAELSRGMLAVAGGDLTVEVAVRSKDEFGVLAQAFQRMRDELRRAAQLRSAFDGFVTRALAEREGRSGRAASEGARLAMAVHGGQESAVAALLEAARSHGGEPERVEVGGMCLLFPSAHAGDLPQERAVRCALAALAAAPGPGWACGIAVGGQQAAARALALARSGLRTGTDLLVDPPAYAAIAAGFFADQVHEREGHSGHLLEQAWAVKGAVSSGATPSSPTSTR
jgi:HAMP domain-containing protein